MTTIVVSGGAKGVGKTQLVCGLIGALSEYRWTAVKVTSHDHGNPVLVWEEKSAGQRTDTARYLAAGAARAFLVTTLSSDLSLLLHELLEKLDPDANLLFESNGIMDYLQPDLCLALEAGDYDSQPKASFGLTTQRADALVAHRDEDRMLRAEEPPQPVFHLADLERVSPEMLAWLRAKLKPAARS